MDKSKQIGGDHYAKHKIQPWDIIDEYGLNFYAGNVLKYLLRYKDKGGVEDLKKAQHYLEKLIQMEETMQNLEHTLKNIVGWADERGLLKNSTPQAQMMKLVEEIGELSVAIQKGKKADTIDALGDTVVVLNILAAQLGLELSECINAAWEEIKDRKGYLNEDGIFVKEQV